MVSVIDLRCCSAETLLFAAIGKFVVFLAIYTLLSLIIRGLILSIYDKKYSELNNDKKTLVNLATVFWPIAIIVMVVWWLIEAILLPFTAARKRDLRELRTELVERIDETCNPQAQELTKFKVGELITGIRGNPDNYNHLNEGCVCRVTSIDERGRMKVVLVDHKDFSEHVDVIGKVFKAPERNFVKFTKRTSKVKKVAKKK